MICFACAARASAISATDFTKHSLPRLRRDLLYDAGNFRSQADMRNSMMNVPLTPLHFIERAGRFFGNVEIVSRLPSRALHRCTYRDVYDRAWRLAGLL